MILLPSREIVQPCPRCGLPPLDPRDPRRWWRHGACRCCGGCFFSTGPASLNFTFSGLHTALCGTCTGWSSPPVSSDTNSIKTYAISGFNGTYAVPRQGTPGATTVYELIVGGPGEGKEEDLSYDGEAWTFRDGDAPPPDGTAACSAGSNAVPFVSYPDDNIDGYAIRLVVNNATCTISQLYFYAITELDDGAFLFPALFQAFSGAAVINSAISNAQTCFNVNWGDRTGDFQSANTSGTLTITVP